MDRFFITQPSYYSDIEGAIAYARERGATKVYLRDLHLDYQIYLEFVRFCKKYHLLLFINSTILRNDFVKFSDISGIHFKSNELESIISIIEQNLGYNFQADLADSKITLKKFLDSSANLDSKLDSKLDSRFEFADLLFSASAHSKDDVIKAYNAKIDYIFLSPIYPVVGKNPPLGVEYIAKIPQKYKDRIYALGGINENNLVEFKTIGIKGVAGISMFDRK